MGSTMSAVVAETAEGARARVIVDGYPVEFVAETIHEAIHQVQRRAVALAREREAPVQLRAEDPQNLHHLLVAPDGQITIDPDKGEQRAARRRPGFLRRPEEPAAPLPVPPVAGPDPAEDDGRTAASDAGDVRGTPPEATSPVDAEPALGPEAAAELEATPEPASGPEPAPEPASGPEPAPRPEPIPAGGSERTQAPAPAPEPAETRVPKPSSSVPAGSAPAPTLRPAVPPPAGDHQEVWATGPLSDVVAGMADPRDSGESGLGRPRATDHPAPGATGAHWGEGAPSTFLPDPSVTPPLAPPKKSLFGALGGGGRRRSAQQAPPEPMTFGAPQAPSHSDARLLRRRHPRPATIAVVNPKGGAGKTPLTLLLAAAFAEHTNGVLAWDNNPFRGTLGWRIETAEHGGTVGSLLADLDRLRGRELRLSDIDAYVHPQEDGVDVLPGDPMAIETGTVGGVQVEALWSHLNRYYRVIVMDSGNDERSPGWQSMIARADQIVVVSSTRYEVAESARLMLDSLSRGDDHARHLARSAVAVVSQAHPDEDIERDPSLATARQIADGFAYLARASVVVPYDPAVATIRLRWQALAPATRAAVTRAAALVAAGLPAQ